MNTNHPPADESGQSSSELRDESRALIEALGREDASELVQRAAQNEELLDRTMAAARGVTPIRSTPRHAQPRVASGGMGKYLWPIAAVLLLAVGYMLRPRGQAPAPQQAASSVIE